MKTLVSTSGNTWLIAWSIFQVGVVTLILNTSSLFFTPLYLWPRIITPALLAVGFAGALRGWKWLRFVGWTGIGLFLLIAVGTAIPDEDYRLFGSETPGPIAGEYALGRFALLLQVGISLVANLKLLAKSQDSREVYPLL